MEILALVVVSAIFLLSLVRNVRSPDKHKGLKLLVLLVLISMSIWTWQDFSPSWNRICAILISLVALIMSQSFVLSRLQKTANKLTSGLGMRCYVDVFPHDVLSEELSVAGFREEGVNLDEMINAGAIVSEKGMRFVLFTGGALIRCTCEEQNFILAHEIAHHYLGHCEPAWFRKWWAKTIMLSLVGIGGGLIGIGLFAALRQSHSRNKEFAADRCGVELLAQKGLSSRGAVKLCQRWVLLEERFNWFCKASERLFGTHPMSRARLRNVKRHIREIEIIR